MRIFEVIKKPVLSEKSYSGIDNKKYVFEVALDSNKVEIKKAVEDLFGVSVKSINTVITRGKKVRRGKNITQKSDTKKAYVELTANSKPLEFFEGVK